MDDLEEDLRATSESIARDAARLQELELEKASLGVDDPRMSVLSEEGERLGVRLARSSAAERELADLAAENAGGSSRP